ncbi:MAG: hypothetical protein EA412_03380 [Chitinophagaceae bacterium]|nr:MAG: hypothetical protein EA412_03380 [Chitinophagaceae bacterium]
MYWKNYFFLISLLAVFLTSCSATEKTEDTLIEEITKLENKLFEDNLSFEFSENIRNELIEKYDAFYSQYPNHSIAPEYLFRLADLHRSAGDPVLAARTYERTYAEYPTYENRAQVLFLIGFTYENEVNDTSEARFWYNRFLEVYPEHPLTKDVEFSLNFLGKSPEEMIRLWESQQDNQ